MLMIGSMRSAESIRTKIIRVMASYKEAHERINNTGNGIHGFEKDNTFQEYIVRDICKYYFELDPVLRDRPNVYPHYTNEDEKVKKYNGHIPSNKEKSTIFLTSSDDDSIGNGDDESIGTDDTDDGEDDTCVQYAGTESNKTHTNLFTNSKLSISTTNTDINNDISISSPSSSDNLLSSSSSSRTVSNNPKRQCVRRKNKMTPLEAKKNHKLMKKKKKKSIASKMNIDLKKSIGTRFTDDDRDLLKKSRKEKFDFEMERHNDLKNIESEKLKLEKERLNMERDNMRMKQNYITAQTNLEKNKIILLRMEMFKERQRIKKENPTITEDDLNELFPYPN